MLSGHKQAPSCQGGTSFCASHSSHSPVKPVLQLQIPLTAAGFKHQESTTGFDLLNICSARGTTKNLPFTLFQRTKRGFLYVPKSGDNFFFYSCINLLLPRAECGHLCFLTEAKHPLNSGMQEGDPCQQLSSGHTCTGYLSPHLCSHMQ